MKNATAAANDAEVNMRELAIMAQNATDGSSEAATNWLADYLLADQAVLGAILALAIRRFARWHVDLVAKARRDEQPALMPSKVVPIDGSVFRNAVNDRYMSRPIWGGKAIGDCTAAEIAASAVRFDSQAKTMSREASWQAAVAKAVEGRCYTSHTHHNRYDGDVP